MLMDPTNQTFQELLSNGVKYKVPKFQRDYSWDIEQWEDLWNDIKDLGKDDYHYMGYIVLQKKSENEFEIIDGQQRLITISLIILVALKKLRGLIKADDDEVDNNQEREDLMRSGFIGFKDMVSLKVDSKLTLNRNNNTYYKNICSKLESPNLIGMTKTNKLLKKAFNFFALKNFGESGNKISQFIKQFTSHFVFTKIVVQDSLNAYKVFETLNARGVQLSTPDLLKNYIFSIVTKNDDVLDDVLDELDEDWSLLVTQLGERSFTDFIRYHHNIQNKLSTKKVLFKSIRELYTKPKDAYSYLNSLGEYASIYSALLNPYDEWWKSNNGNYENTKYYLEGLKLFNIKQPFTVLMVALKYFSDKEFLMTLKYIYNFTIRYNVICHFSPNEQEKLYNQIAIKIFNGEFKRASAIKNSPEFKKLYPDDNTFENAFEFYKLPSRASAKKIRFLLSEIENNLGKKVDYLNVVLEHVCPYNSGENWFKTFGIGISDIQDRLGNMLLLEKDELKRDSFIEKKKLYSKTDFNLAKKIAEYETWDLQNVNRYQKWLAKQAVKTWGIDWE
ncbi:MAG: RloF protein [Candidatus Cloacimonadota bacterium]|nr:MAG: RloF protein [Candidatus Cloacimonadota bacterium]